MDKRCFLVGRKDSLFKQLVASLLVDMMDNLDLHENTTADFKIMLDEYYRLHEWDAEGDPTAQLLERHQITELRPAA